MADKKQTNKISIEDVLNKKKLIEKDTHYFSTYFNREIDIERIDKQAVIDLMAESEDEILKYQKLIYLSCPFFRNKELHEALEINDPYDSVSACYDDNICEIIELGNIILKRYGFTADKVERIKKQ